MLRINKLSQMEMRLTISEQHFVMKGYAWIIS